MCVWYAVLCSARMKFQTDKYSSLNLIEVNPAHNLLEMKYLILKLYHSSCKILKTAPVYDQNTTLSKLLMVTIKRQCGILTVTIIEINILPTTFSAIKGCLQKVTIMFSLQETWTLSYKENKLQSKLNLTA